MTFSRLFEAVAHVDEIVRSSVAETRNGLLGARSSRLAPVVRFQTLARVLRHHSGKVVLPARTPCKRACATRAGGNPRGSGDAEAGSAHVIFGVVSGARLVDRWIDG